MKSTFIRSKLMLVPLFIIMAAFTFTLTFFDDTPFIKQLLNNQTELNNTYSPERVYISTDKTHYVQGETVYMTGFVRDGNSLTPTEKSRVLHVELTDHTGIVLKKKSYYFTETAEGSIDLDKNMPAGNYQLKGYTTWQRNDAHALVFTKTIYVQNIKQTNNSLTKPGMQAIVKFYPEGGDLVNGLPTVMAFSVEDEYGNPIEFSGNIKGSMGTNIVFSANDKGMGKFNIIPAKGETYSVNNQGPKIWNVQANLPEIADNGYTLNLVSKDENNVTFTVNAQQAATTTVALKLRDELVYAKQHILKAGANTIAIPTGSFQQGVAQVTLFDGNEVAQAERLVYINKHKKLNIEITPRKSTYLPGEDVTAAVKVTDNEGKPVKGNFTLSVLDGDLQQMEAGMDGDIKSKLLLEPDLKGDIKNSAYYLSEAEGADEALDLLCMTRGWRRFEWKEVKNFQPSVFLHQNETNRVAGTLVDNKNKKALPGKMVKLYLIGSDSLYKYNTFTNEKGEFTFDNLPRFADGRDMRLLVTINGTRHTYKLPYYSSSLVANEFGLKDNNVVYGDGFGQVSGKLVDKFTDAPLNGVLIQLKKEDEYTGKYATTAADGSFTFSNINAGDYELYIPVEGKKKPEKVSFAKYNEQGMELKVRLDGKKGEATAENVYYDLHKPFALNVFSFKEAVTLPETFVEKPRIVAPGGGGGERPGLSTVDGGATYLQMIDQGHIGTGTDLDAEDLMKKPVRDIISLGATASRATKSPSGGLSIGGSRVDGTVLLVDGVQMPMSTVIPTAGIASMSILTGGIPAQYGDFTGGAIIINTKSPDVVGFGSWADTAIMETYYARVRDFGEMWEEDTAGGKELVDLFTTYHPTTVYWDGTVTTDENGLAEVTFANAGFEGNFAMVVEGASVNGLLGKGVSKFTSLDKMSLTIGDYEIKDGQLKVKVKVKNNTAYDITSSFTFVYSPQLNLVSPDPTVSYIKKQHKLIWDGNIFWMDKYIKSISVEANGESELEFVYAINGPVEETFFAAEVSNSGNRIAKTSLLPHIK